MSYRFAGGEIRVFFLLEKEVVFRRPPNDISNTQVEQPLFRFRVFRGYRRPHTQKNNLKKRKTQDPKIGKKNRTYDKNTENHNIPKMEKI